MLPLAAAAAPSAPAVIVPFIEITRVRSVAVILLSTAKLPVPRKLAVVPEFWNWIGTLLLVALSVGTQLITVCGAVTEMVVVPVPLVMVVAAPLVAVPVPRKLCAAAGLGPTTNTVASASTEQPVRASREGRGKLRIMTSRATNGW